VKFKLALVIVIVYHSFQFACALKFVSVVNIEYPHDPVLESIHAATITVENTGSTNCDDFFLGFSHDADLYNRTLNNGSTSDSIDYQLYGSNNLNVNQILQKYDPNNPSQTNFVAVASLGLIPGGTYEFTYYIHVPEAQSVAAFDYSGDLVAELYLGKPSQTTASQSDQATFLLTLTEGTYLNVEVGVDDSLVLNFGELTSLETRSAYLKVVSNTSHRVTAQSANSSTIVNALYPSTPIPYLFSVAGTLIDLKSGLVDNILSGCQSSDADYDFLTIPASPYKGEGVYVKL